MIKRGKRSQRHLIMPIFVPHMGCPHHCVFCNQASITGANPKISPGSITHIINEISEKVALRCSKYFFFGERKPLSLRFNACEVTLSGFAGGEYLPLPASKGLAFPSLLTLDGYPTSPADCAQGQRFSPVIQETPKRKDLNSRSEPHSPVFQGPLNDQLRAQRGRLFRREVAFYGGSFTGIEKKVQIQLLSAVQPLIRKGLIDSVRVSTRPDYIDSQTLDFLEEYGVLTVELGVQSMVEEVLQCSRRGHTADDVLKAVGLLHGRGFEVGIQIMVGLPGDDAQGNAFTVDRVIGLNPHFVRIYPTVVLKGTLLLKWYRSGRYTPLSLEEAVDLCKRAYLKFHRAGIPVIRLGLQSSPELEAEDCVVAGPYHPAFRHLVESSLFYDMASCLMGKSREARILRARVSPSDVSNIRGQKNRNLYQLRERFGLSDIQIEVDMKQPRGSLILMNGRKLNRMSYQTLPFS